MTTLYMLYALEDRAYVKQLRVILEGEGYNIVQAQAADNVRTLSAHSNDYAIMGSAAVILIWSAQAQHTPQVTQQLALAQQLCKQVYPLFADSTPLVLAGKMLRNVLPQQEAFVQLLALLPPAHSHDPFVLLCEQASQDDINQRKAAIEQAVEMLRRGEHADEIRAVLACMAKNDLLGVREKAFAALSGSNQPAPVSPSAPVAAGDARFTFGLTCKNGHITYFDKRQLCKEQRKTIYRSINSNKVSFLLSCGHEGCNLTMEHDIDCEGHR